MDEMNNNGLTADRNPEILKRTKYVMPFGITF